MNAKPAVSNEALMAMANAGRIDAKTLRQGLIKIKKAWERDRVTHAQHITDRQISNGLRSVIRHTEVLRKVLTPALAKILEVNRAQADLRSGTPAGAALLEFELLKEIECVRRLQDRGQDTLKEHNARLKDGTTFSFEKANAQQTHIDGVCEAILDFWQQDLGRRVTVSPDSALVHFAQLVLANVAQHNLGCEAIKKRLGKIKSRGRSKVPGHSP